MIKKISIIILALLLAGCSPYQRLQRLHKRHPYLFENVKDTVTITYKDTIYIPETKIDTIINTNYIIEWLKDPTNTDSIKIQNEKLKITLSKYKDSLKIEAENKGDTLYIEKIIQVPVDKYKVIVKKDIYSYVLLFLLFIVFVYLIYRFYKTIKDNG